MKTNLNFTDGLKLSVFSKICPTCNERFVPKNRKMIFCGPYCKHVWHYEKSKLEFENEKKMSTELKLNYRVLKKSDNQGIHSISREALYLLGFNPNVIPPVINYKGKQMAIYNCYGLYFENNFFHIIKISTWKLNNQIS